MPYTDLTISYTTPEGLRRSAIIPAEACQIEGDIAALSAIVIALNDRVLALEKGLDNAAQIITMLMPDENDNIKLGRRGPEGTEDFVRVTPFGLEAVDEEPELPGLDHPGVAHV